MQSAVLALYPNTKATYKFTNRRLSDKFNQKFLKGLISDINALSELRLTPKERHFIETKLSYLSPSYVEYLTNYKFDPNELEIGFSNDGELEISISGSWHHTILWEVPLMALISENYFKHVVTKWNDAGQAEKLHDKALVLAEGKNELYDESIPCNYADFSTRRRRNFESQERVVSIFKNKPGFVGTSNVYLAMLYDTSPIGTMAHEWIMAHSVLGSMRHANKSALQSWNTVYQGRLGIALTDTYGTNAFFNDFDGVLARLFDGVRHDSGDPFGFIDTVINGYNKLKIDPTSKTIVFSDSLNPELAVKIKRACVGKIKCSFGIGTNFSNDYEGTPALNMVIKLRTIDGIPVVKLSDDAGKATGDRDAIRVAKWMFLNKPLDEV